MDLFLILYFCNIFEDQSFELGRPDCGLVYQLPTLTRVLEEAWEFIELVYICFEDLVSLVLFVPAYIFFWRSTIWWKTGSWLEQLTRAHQYECVNK